MKPLILISNDDSINAKGIKHIVNIAKEIGEVIVVAPHSPQSAKAHAITIADPLRMFKSTVFGDDVVAYSCTGTPVDCVKLAKTHLLKDRRPDIILSGINHGSNASISVIYSGTMGAALEGAVDNIPSVGFSVCDYDHECELKHTSPFIKKIIEDVLKNGMTEYTAYNVNFPAFDDGEIKGLKVCRQNKGAWDEAFDERTDPYNGKYFWMAGDYKSRETATDTDIYALNNNYISLVPCHVDLTNYDAMKDASRLEE